MKGRQSRRSISPAPVDSPWSRSVLRRAPRTGNIARGSRARHCMAEFHGNEAWGTAIIIPPCSSGSRPAMTAALRLRLSLLVLFLLLLAAERNIEAGIKYLRHLADAY